MPHDLSHSLIRRLAHVPIFSQLPDRTLLKVLGAAANLYWADGSLVFEQGDHAEALYIVISGCVEILEGEDEVIASVGEDGFFGEMGLMRPDATHTRTVRASGDTELLTLRREWLEALLESDPGLAAHFRRVFEERIAELGDSERVRAALGEGTAD